jgi:DNA-binding beta-propeller fold protein YncE
MKNSWAKSIVSLAVFAACLAASACYRVIADQGARPPHRPATQLRRPVAAAFLSDGQTLCVANQRSGTLALVDVRPGRLLEEKAIGEHLNDLAVLPDGKQILTVDDERHELIALSHEDGRLRLRARLAVAPYPVSVAVQPDGKRAAIAALWSRRLQIIDLTPLSSRSEAPQLCVLHTLRLPFAPRCLCVLPGSSRIVVADAFGGHLALVDAAAGRVIAVHELNGHNLRGLAVSADGKRLLIAHQILNQQTPVLEEKIWRGFLLTNVVRAIPLGSDLPERRRHRRRRPGRTGRAGHEAVCHRSGRGE